MADYSPQQDPTIPCADAGMSFRKGDVLEIVDQTDALWWQAKKLPSNTACAGLIPSTNLLKRSENFIDLLRYVLFDQKHEKFTLTDSVCDNRKQREFWWSQPYQPHACIQTCKSPLTYLKTLLNESWNSFRIANVVSQLSFHCVSHHAY